MAGTDTIFTHGDAMNADRDTLYKEWVNMLAENGRLREDLKHAHASVRRWEIFDLWSRFFAAMAYVTLGIGAIFCGVGAAALAILYSLSLFGII